MQFYKRYKFQIITAVFLGLCTAIWVDVFIKPYFGMSAQTAEPLYHTISFHPFIKVCMLYSLAVTLKYYVKPFSKVGAFMTGFCSYALIFFIFM